MDFTADAKFPQGIVLPNYSTESPVREALFRAFLAQKKTFSPTRGNVFVPIRDLVLLW